MTPDARRNRHRGFHRNRIDGRLPARQSFPEGALDNRCARVVRHQREQAGLFVLPHFPVRLFASGMLPTHDWEGGDTHSVIQVAMCEKNTHDRCGNPTPALLFWFNPMVLAPFETNAPHPAVRRGEPVGAHGVQHCLCQIRIHERVDNESFSSLTTPRTRFVLCGADDV